MAIYWIGSDPSKCDLCGKEDLKEFYDAMTKMGPWGCICKKCFKTHGIGLGTGLGQYYIKEGKNFIKKAG